MGYAGSGGNGISKTAWWHIRGWWMLALPAGVGFVQSPIQAQKQPAYVLTVVATDDPLRTRKVVPVLTSGDKFVEVFVPVATPVIRRNTPKKNLPLTAVKTGWQFTCAGDWTDSTRSVFRV